MNDFKSNFEDGNIDNALTILHERNQVTLKVTFISYFRLLG